MSLVSIVIPFSPNHKDVVGRAVSCAHNQTVQCVVFVAEDTQRVGAGVMRNRLLSHINTPFVIFLDADDTIEPNFVQRCLEVYNQNPGHYVYTNWIEHLSNGLERVVEAPERPWCAGTWHCITALIPTAWAKAVNGFDEQLPALEDTDFFLKLTTNGGCGIRILEPLFHYQARDDGRARTFHKTGQVELLKNQIKERYIGMGAPCCGGGKTQYGPPVGQKQPGDVLATIIPGGRMSRFGKVSGRNYPYSGPGDAVWVDPRDAIYEPQIWRIIDPNATNLSAAPIPSSFTMNEFYNSAPAPQPQVQKPAQEVEWSTANVPPPARQTSFEPPSFEEIQQQFDQARFVPAIRAANRQMAEAQVKAEQDLLKPQDIGEIQVDWGSLTDRAKKALGLDTKE